MAGQRIKLRRDTAANWTSANPILADGEQGFEKVTKKVKIGDGVTNWNTLTYQSSDWADVTNKPAIPAAQVSSDWNSVASPTQILNKPVIPAAQVNSDWNSVAGLSQIANKPDLTLITIDGGVAAG